MITVGQLARRFALSRSTLLYYDRIGLLSPTARSAAGYRQYSEADVERMEAIHLYRRAGLGLADIARVLDHGGDSVRVALEARLAELDGEIEGLRGQQRLILELVRGSAAGRRLDKAGWIEILAASGLDEAARWRWHAEFERSAPEAHGEFMKSLGIATDEVARIRSESAALAEKLGLA